MLTRTIKVSCLSRFLQGHSAVEWGPVIHRKADRATAHNYNSVRGQIPASTKLVPRHP